jgi:hypothetical protein
MKISDLWPSHVRSWQGELALETFPGVPIGANECRSLFDVTLQAGMRYGWSGLARRPDCNSRNLSPRVGFANLKSAIERGSILPWVLPDSVGAPVDNLPFQGARGLFLDKRWQVARSPQPFRERISTKMKSVGSRHWECQNEVAPNQRIGGRSRLDQRPFVLAKVARHEPLVWGFH